MTQLLEEEQLWANKMLVRDQSGLTRAMGARFEQTPAQVQGLPPALGQHTRQVLLEGGYSAEEIDGLFKDKVVFESSPKAKL